MRTVHATLLTLGLAALIAGPAAAAGPGPRLRPHGGSYSGLARQRQSVQKELKLDDKQVEKAKELDEKMNERGGARSSRVSRTSKPQERRAKMTEIMNGVNATALKTAGEFLNPEQITRLKQIANQQRGAQSFADAEVAKKLNITETQKTDIQTIQQESTGGDEAHLPGIPGRSRSRDEENGRSAQADARQDRRETQ